MVLPTRHPGFTTGPGWTGESTGMGHTWSFGDCVQTRQAPTTAKRGMTRALCSLVLLSSLCLVSTGPSPQQVLTPPQKEPNGKLILDLVESDPKPP